jgi:hypothetical protein
LETTTGGQIPAARDTTEVSFDDEVAFFGIGVAPFQDPRRRGACHQQADARTDGAAVRAGQRNLLADDRSEIRIEGEQKLLDLAALRIAAVEANTARVVEDSCLEKAE